MNGVLSAGLGLGLERHLAWTAMRTVVRLLAVSFVLEWVFTHAHQAAVLGIVAVMTLIMGHAAGGRGAHGCTGSRLGDTLSVFGSAWLIDATGLVVVPHVHPWCEPQYAIPITGMILGNTLTDVGLALERMIGELTTARDQVETILTLGDAR